MLRPILTCLTLLTAQTANAQCAGPSLLTEFSPETRATMEQRAAQTPYPTGLLWEATKDDTTITLAGTVHIADPRLGPIFDALLAPLSQADVLLTEVTPAEESAMLRALSEDRTIAFITEGPTLIDQVDPELWDQISTALNARQMPAFMGAQMQPWYLGLVLSMPPCAMASMARGERGLDHMLMTQAEQIGVPNLPLEGWEGLLDLLSDGTPQEQIDMLALTINMDDYTNPATVALLDYYFAGETALAWELGRASIDLLPMDPVQATAMFDEIEDLLLVQRNLNWMPVIMEQAALHDTILIAVGAAHLPGETGLLQLLDNDGWAMRQLSSP